MTNYHQLNTKSRLARTIMFVFFCTVIVSCKSQDSTIKGPIEIPLTLKYTSGISSIFEDSKGNFWFGSHQEGVAIFDGQSFRYFTTEDDLSDNQIRTIQEDQNGHIWLGTGNGVTQYDGLKFVNWTPNSTLSYATSKHADWSKADTDLWFNAGNSPGTFRYNGQEIHYLEFPKPEINPDYQFLVTDIDYGKNQVWFATYAGVFGFDGRLFTNFNNANLERSSTTGYLHIRSILEDSQGNLWIGNNGIGVLLNDGQKTMNFSSDHGLIHFNTSRSGGKSPKGTMEHVFCIEEDSEGNIWFGDRDTGVWSFDGKTMRNYTLEDGIPNAFVQEIYKDKSGILWFGLGDGSVYQFDGERFERKFQ